MRVLKYFIFWMLIAIGCFLVYYLPYSEVKRRSRESMYTQEFLLASQTSRGIEKFFDHYSRSLNFLSGEQGIVDFDERGKQVLQRFYKNNAGEISAITRIDPDGRIICTVPFNEEAIGRDVSYQEHNSRILKTHEPVSSDVFTAVQGYRSVAYIYPIFKDGNFVGSLGLLIPFDHLARKYLEDLRIGREGYTWMMSKRGIQLFSPIPGHTGINVRESFSDYPEILSILDDMVSGRRENAVIEYRPGGVNSTELVKYLSTCVPVNLPDNTWYLLVMVPEGQVLETMEEFRKKWIAVSGLLVSLGLIVSFYLVKARAIVREEKKRKRAEQELKESEERFRQLSDSTWEAILIVDGGKIIHANDQFFEMFGYERGELEAKTILPIIFKNGSMGTLMDFIDHKRSGPLEAEGVRKNGENFPVEIRIRIMEYYGATAKVLSIRDISDRVRAEKEKADLYFRLRQKQKMEALGTLAGGIAHDFNNILTGIIGYADFSLMDSSNQGEVRENLEIIREAGHRAKNLVKQILAFSRQTKPDLKILDIAMIVEDAMKLLAPTIPKTIQIDSRIDHESGFVKADPTQIHQVLMNLVTNAVSAMADGGVLRISLERERLEDKDGKLQPGVDPGEYAIITVSDTGTGMDGQVIERIFEPFFTTKEPSEGIGMGLSVVHGIVQEHNGLLTVKSELNKGTQFSVFLPLVPGIMDEEEEEIDIPSGRKERILFVDDEKDIVNIEKKMLERFGFRVEATTSSEEALDIFAKDPAGFDIIVTDQIMPGLNGLELIQKIFQIRTDIPVILCSGFSSLISGKKTGRMGIDKFIMKPYTSRHLAHMIVEVLDGRSTKI